jgi:hypothetical protein
VDWFIRYGKARGGTSVIKREINGWKRMREEEKAEWEGVVRGSGRSGVSEVKESDRGQ